MMAAEKPLVIANATGCLQVTTSIYPYSNWNHSWIHSAFENTSATIGGVEAAYKALRKFGKLDQEFSFIAFGGDGGTFDIGLQSLSGALERGHNFVYVCYDNEAYMNTGIQRSSATPQGAWTTTSPVGKAQPGKLRPRKNLTEIAIAHSIPYVAQASPHNWRDLYNKAQKAFAVEGPALLNVISPCIAGWRYDPEYTVQMARDAVESLYWPLYEVENGVYKITYSPKERKPVTEWLKKQGRFRHLFDPANKDLLDALIAQIDEDWELLQKRAAMTQA
jgi:pyruvate ferredoxin oxidoreductase beta subunit